MKKLILLLLLVINLSGINGQKISTLDLSGSWKLTWNEGGHGPQTIEAFLRSDPDADPPRFIDAEVPMEIHKVLEKAGLVEDLNFGINTLKARWVAEKYWLYVKRFSAPEASGAGSAWLVFDQLDLNATILLNGEVVGTHHNVFYPCRLDVTGKLKQGENLLQVGIESGLYGAAEKNGEDYIQNMGALLNKRHWLRKPQYQFLWDWNPQLINVGITSGVRLEWSNAARLDQVVVQCKVAENLQNAELTVKPFIEVVARNKQLSIKALLKETGQSAEMTIPAGTGLSSCKLLFKIDKPELWWPAGHGNQKLYTLEVELKEGNRILESRTIRTGIRKIDIDRSPHPVEGNYFTIIINNRKIFIKGGNWVPPEMIYSSTTRQKLETLTDLAIKANFNMLRIWGGAIWAGHDLLELCDQKGIIVWHDLLFACSKYPADDLEFTENVIKEITWGVREFSSHPSLTVWCGNNENEVGTFSWGWDKWGKQMPDYGLYHLTMPRILAEEDPTRPFWPSSPFSEGQVHPNSPLTGDQHPWDVSLGAAGPDFWQYRKYVDRFPNEGGVMGASSPATIRQFLPEKERFLRSFTWDHHDNEVNFWNYKPGVNYALTEFWVGRSAEELGFEKYILTSGLIQAEGLMEYITNYRRRMFSTSSAIFWMYNDSWPVTHGWTIVDYYLRKKLAYHPVRRAFEPVTVVIAEENDSLKFFGVNDSPSEWRGELRFGIFLMKGGTGRDKTTATVIPAGKSVMLAALPVKGLENELNDGGAFALLNKDGKMVSRHRLFTKRFRDLQFAKPVVKISRSGNSVSFASDVFVWGLCIDTDGEKEVADNCFDLIPGIPHTIEWTSKDLPVVKFTGNSIFEVK